MSNRSLVAEPQQHSITATSIFKAPRELVFKVMTDPATIPQWWGPSNLTTTVDRMEPWSGGSWRYVLSDGKGHEWRFHGVYHAIEAPIRNIFTYEDEDLPGKVSLESTVYEEYDGGTKVITTSVFQTIADRDAMMTSGMQEGGAETMDRLGALLARMQTGS